ncbi:major facilitator superfamily domain-containing protein [Pelagophyceae sp. CCMP2097]|nr:major facilitator superfamily domain-containing protein [Pelagophyceae sp. CCMP2097]
MRLVWLAGLLAVCRALRAGGGGQPALGRRGRHARWKSGGARDSTDATDADAVGSALEVSHGNGRYEFVLTACVGLGLYGGPLAALAPVLLDPLMAADSTLSLDVGQLSLGSSALFASWGFGGVGLAFLADKLGRRTVVAPCAVGAVLSTMALANVHADANCGVPVFAQVLAFKAVLGLYCGGFSAPSFLLLTESVPPSRRSAATTNINLSFALAALCVALLHKACEILGVDWRGEVSAHAFWMTAAAAAVQLYTVESPAFLAARDETTSRKANDDLQKALEHIAKWNGQPSPHFDNGGDGALAAAKKRGAVAAAQKRASSQDGTVRRPRASMSVSVASVAPPKRSLLWTTVALCFTFGAVEFSYYGLDYATTALATLGAETGAANGGDVLAGFVVANAVDVPGYALAGLLVARGVAAKDATAALLASSGFALALLVVKVLAFHAGNVDGATVNALAALGKLGNAGAFQLVFVVAAGAYPVTKRAAALTFCTAFARLGGLLSAPTAETLSLPVSTGIFAAVSLVAAAAVLALPAAADDSRQGTR